MSRRRWIGLGLLAATVASGACWLFHWRTTWSARAVLETQGMSWDESWKSSFVSGNVGESWPEAFSTDGAALVISEPGSLSLWDAAAGKKRATWTMPGDRRVYEGAFSLDGRTFGAVSWGGGGQPLMIDLVDVATGLVRASLPAPGDGLVGLAFTEKGQNLRAVVSHSVNNKSPNKLVIVDASIASGRVTSSRELSCPLSGSAAHVSLDGRLLAFAFSPTNPTAGPWPHVTVWDLDQDRELARLPGHAEVRGLAFAPDGKTLAIGRSWGSIELRDLEQRTLRTVFYPHKAGFDSRTMQFTPDGSTLASVGEFSREAVTMDTVRFRIHLARGDSNWFPPIELVILDTATGRLILRSPDESRPCFSPDGRFLATNLDDGTVRLRDLPGK